MACGTLTTKKNRRLLGTEDGKPVLLLLRRVYESLLEERKQRIEGECILTGDININDYTCTKCFKSLSTFCKREEEVTRDIGKVLDKLPTVSVCDEELVGLGLAHETNEDATDPLGISPQASICTSLRATSPSTLQNSTAVVDTPRRPRKRRLSYFQSSQPKRQCPDMKV